MSFNFGKSENGHSSKSRSLYSKGDRSSSSEKRSSKNRKRSDSRDSKDSDKKSYRRDRDRTDKEKYRDSYRDSRDDRDKRDNRDSSRNNSKFQNEGMAGANLPKVDWDKSTIIPIQKSFYTESSSAKARSQREIDEFRDKHEITLRGSVQPRPIFSFDEAGFPNYIYEQLVKKFQAPTPIQSQGWPAALGGYDVIGIAQTGSGKTLSFLLPGFVHMNAQPSLKSGDGPIGLVLAPTRELAMQIQEECNKFGRVAKINSVCVFGGADRYGQQRELNRGFNQLIVATPGRLLDFLESGVINLKRVTYLVLDEADRMLDMGFEPQIRRIISQIRPDRQTLMWSATWPKEVQKLALEFCREKPVHIVIGANDLTVNNRIKQNIEVLDNTAKRFRITKILGDIGVSKVLIFTQTKKGADSLASMLGSSNFSAVSIHGDKTQSQRDYIMRQFKTGRNNILVATDLAARGLDVADIRYVVNYDFPTHIEDYIHRVGRTGRAGKDGISYTFFTRDDYKHASKLIDILEETGQEIPEELYRIARRPYRPSNSNSKPTQQKLSSYSYPTSTHGKPTSQTIAPSTNMFLPPQVSQDSKSTSQSQPQPTTQTQVQSQTQNHAQTPNPINYYNAAYFYPQAGLNSYPNIFNGYQNLDPQSSVINQQINTMNYYNQMQAYYSLSNTLNQIDGHGDPTKQAIANPNTYIPQPPPQNQQIAQNPK